MTGRKLSTFMDALAQGRRPRRFRASADDAELVRTAIELRAARPGEAEPSAAFTEGLFRQLADQAVQAAKPNQSVPTRRPVRTALAVAAAAVVLVGGTAVATEALNGPASVHVPQASALRTGTFQTAGGQVLGQIVAYRGEPAWVFMNVNAPNYNGPLTCMLQVEDGSTVAFGTFTVRDGIGQFAKNIGTVDFGRLRGAKLVTPGGSSLATTTFAA